MKGLLGYLPANIGIHTRFCCGQAISFGATGTPTHTQDLGAGTRQVQRLPTQDIAKVIGKESCRYWLRKESVQRQTSAAVEFAFDRDAESTRELDIVTNLGMGIER